MTQILFIATGGALGAVMRYWFSTGVYAWLGRDFPVGTLAVNVIGSLLMGLLFVVFMDRITLSIEWRAAVLIGFLGAFTTFSTFSIETLNLLEQASYFKALMNVLLSVVLSVGAAGVGVMIGRQIG
ncbi:MAG: fluoride efflux transporter CrcB [gamma proteobacterium symbiont of Bathyaustriella thionipta]|nr:fluoride efflux transporter CrcB [gamma proteobacterium symbiont of Bathyaustriella thionipta]